MKYNYYIIRPEISCYAPSSLHYQQEKNQLFIGPHFRLCGIGAQAYLVSRELAERTREALLPRFQKRYGNDTDIIIEEWEATNERVLKAIERDSAIVQERLDKGCLAPNKKP